MAFDPITAILNLGNTVLDRVLPNKPENDAAKAALLKAQLDGEFAAQIAQIQVNQVEAASGNVFVAGWRPFCGWVCGAALGYAFIVQPLAQFILVAFHINFDSAKLPQLDLATLMPILLGMLGLGAMRSWDKGQGTGNGH